MGSDIDMKFHQEVMEIVSYNTMMGRDFMTSPSDIMGFHGPVSL